MILSALPGITSGQYLVKGHHHFEIPSNSPFMTILPSHSLICHLGNILINK
jgi:hypothetical protein